MPAPTIPGETARRKELIERYKQLPDDVKGLFFNPAVADAIREIGQRINLSMNQIGGVADVTGWFLLGLIRPSEFNQRLQIDASLSVERAVTVTRELNEKVLHVARDGLIKIHGKDYAENLLATRWGPLPRPSQTELERSPAPLPPVPPLPMAGPPAPPRPIVPPAWPAPIAPARPVLVPMPAPEISEAEADLTLEKILAGLPHELRAAVRPIPLERVIYTLGRQHQLTIEEIGQLADGVLQFIAGKIHRENLLGTLTKLLKGDRAKAAAAADELNAKVFGPIREAMKQATLPPPSAGIMNHESRIMGHEQPKTKAPEPLIIYPLPMAPKAPPPSSGIRNQESPNQSRFPRDGTGQAGIMGQEAPGVAPPVVSHVEPPPALPVYEELRDRAQKEFADFERAKPPLPPPEKAPLKPPQPPAVSPSTPLRTSRVEPPPAEPHEPDPYREPVE